MRSVSAQSSIIASVALAMAFGCFTVALPDHAAAQTIPASVQTSQLLPPGQNTCQAVTVTSIQPDIYGGVLQAFDVTISDTSNSYVGILAQVDGAPLPLDYITRWAGTPSGLMIHVDTPDTNVSGGVPIQLTLLSSPPGAPTCITTISFAVSGYGLSAPGATNSTGQIYPSTPSYPTYPSQSESSPGSVNDSGEVGNGQHHTGGSVASSAVGSPVLGGSVSSVSNVGLLGSVCSGSNAYRLWFILLVIYIIIVAIVIFAEPWFLESSVVGSTAVILVPLILLLAFWYLSETCRAASWIPVVACVIAIIGLFLAFREYELPPLLPAPEQ